MKKITQKRKTIHRKPDESNGAATPERPRFSMVPKRIWHDRAFRESPDDEKLVVLNLLTNPAPGRCPGLLPVSARAVAEDLGWDDRQLVDSALDKLKARGWVHYDPAARVMLVPWALEAAVPNHDRIILGWRNALAEVADTPLKEEWIAHAACVVRTWAPTLTDFFSEVFADHSVTITEPSGTTETETETETDTETDPGDGDPDEDGGHAPPGAAPRKKAGTEEKGQGEKTDREPGARKAPRGAEGDPVEQVRAAFTEAIATHYGPEYRFDPTWTKKQKAKVAARIVRHGVAETEAIMTLAVRVWDAAVVETDGRLNGVPNVDAICGGFWDYFADRKAGRRARNKRDVGEYRSGPPVGFGWGDPKNRDEYRPPAKPIGVGWK